MRLLFHSLVEKMKKVKQIFCTLNDFLLSSQFFVPKGTIVQVVQMSVSHSDGKPKDAVMIRVSDYVINAVEKNPQEMRLCVHSTSGEPIFLTVSPAILEYHSKKILNLE